MTELEPRELLGRGWAFPVRWNGAGVQLVEAEDAVRQAVGLLLRTGPDERVMRPDFGAGVDDYVFAARTTDTQYRLQEDVRRALVLWEPRVILDRVDAVLDEEDGRIDVHLEYRIDPHRRPQSLVLPFYLEAPAS
jgi:phage baseplate assembly protein W